MCCLALAAHRADSIARSKRGEPATTMPAANSLASRRLIAAYDVPAFMDAAWLAGLAHESVKFQVRTSWFTRAEHRNRPMTFRFR